MGGFTVGGTIEVPVLLQAAAEGLVVVAVMAIFGAFNSVVSHDELVRAAPRAFYEPGLVVTVGLTFVPFTLLTITAVREADRARTGGRPVRRGRALRMVVPVLETGLERAISLAESMDSRGFARARPAVEGVVSGWAALASLLGLLGAFVALVGRARTAAIVLGTFGVAALVVAVTAASRAGGPMLYRRRRLTPIDIGVMAAALMAPAAVVAVLAFSSTSLVWTTNPPVAPSVNALALLALAPLALPAVLPGDER